MAPAPGLAACLTALLLASWAADQLHLSVPPAIIGLCGLLLGLLLSRRLRSLCEDGCQLLLDHLGLMILPAAVGAIWLAPRWAEHWLALLLVIVVATLLSLVVVAWALNRLLHRSQQ